VVLLRFFFFRNGIVGGLVGAFFFFVVVLMVPLLMSSSSLRWFFGAFFYAFFVFVVSFLFYSSYSFFFHPIFPILFVLFSLSSLSCSFYSSCYFHDVGILLFTTITFVVDPLITPSSPLPLVSFVSLHKMMHVCYNVPSCNEHPSLTWLLTSFWSSIMTPRLTPLYFNPYAS